MDCDALQKRVRREEGSTAADRLAGFETPDVKVQLSLGVPPLCAAKFSSIFWRCALNTTMQSADSPSMLRQEQFGVI